MPRDTSRRERVSQIPPTRIIADNHNRVRGNRRDGECDRRGRRLPGDAIAALSHVFTPFGNVKAL